jgi:Ulp1 family protease
MRNYLRDETGGLASIRDWRYYQMDNPLKHSMPEDCGVFVLRTAEMVVRGEIPFLPIDKMRVLRSRIMVEIINQKI